MSANVVDSGLLGEEEKMVFAFSNKVARAKSTEGIGQCETR